MSMIGTRYDRWDTPTAPVRLAVHPLLTKQEMPADLAERDRFSVAAESIAWSDMPAAVPPKDATGRQGQELVEFILRLSPSPLRERFLVEVAYAAANAVAENDLWLIADVLRGWEADAEISASPEFAAQVNESLAGYRAGDKGRPWDEIARELGLGGGSAT